MEYTVIKTTVLLWFAGTEAKKGANEVLSCLDLYFNNLPDGIDTLTYILMGAVDKIRML